MPTPIEITAVFLRERLRFANADGDVIIGDIRHVAGPKPDGANCKLAIKGPAEIDQLKTGLPYRFFGRWAEYRNPRSGETEQQFAYQTVVPAKPIGEAGIVTYLARHGDGLGIGEGRAKILYEAFGADAVKICREQPEEAFAAVPKWKLDQAHTLAERLQRAATTEECSIELVELLDRRGFPRATAQQAMNLWGNCAPDFIRRNPYVLMQFRGCGFKRCDAMYLDLGLNPNKLKRQALCAWYSVASDSAGHTWFPVERAIQGIKQNVAGCELRIEQALKLAKRGGALAFARTDSDGAIVERSGKLWCAETKNADHEEFIARCIVAAESEPREWPDAASIPAMLTDHQREHLAAATGGMIGILGGGPGTGKTFSAAQLICAILAEQGVGSIAVAAPTGKAAVRISEALAAYQIPIRATTIHSLLRVDPLEGGFHFRQGRPLPFRYLVVDESSMIDTDLMASLLAARGTGTHILFVGDVHQLPPVGHGAPLRDFIAAGLPYGELHEIQRQAAGSMIVQACHAIRAGRPYQALPNLESFDGGDANLVRIEAAKPDQQIAATLNALRWAKENGFDPIWDVQVLAAVNAKSQLARKPLNKLLQGELNSQPLAKGCPFKLGDKIVNCKNQNFRVVAGDDDEPESDGEETPLEIRVANGDLAEVIEVAEKYFLARLVVGGHVVRIPRGRFSDDDDAEKPADGDDSESDKGPATGCTWDLAYVLSVHKSQGSEWPMTIVLLDEYPGAMRIASREWLYTASSRGKKLAVEIGKEETARKMIRRVALGDRKTLLKERINFEQCKLLVEAM